MRTVKISVGIVAVLGMALLAVWLARPKTALAHCDTPDGPVVTEAKTALEKGDVTPVLKWVKPQYEEEVRTAFNKVLAVRTKGPQAKELADMYFFETLVRLHRAGEGASYTGLKPAGSIEPPVAAADKAIDAGNIDDLAKRIGQAAENGVRKRFERVMEMWKHKNESIEAGREYVEAYVTFVHYVEGLHNTITVGGAHHNHNQGREAEGHLH